MFKLVHGMIKLGFVYQEKGGRKMKVTRSYS